MLKKGSEQFLFRRVTKKIFPQSDIAAPKNQSDRISAMKVNRNIVFNTKTDDASSKGTTTNSSSAAFSIGSNKENEVPKNRAQRPANERYDLSKYFSSATSTADLGFTAKLPYRNTASTAISEADAEIETDTDQKPPECTLKIHEKKKEAEKTKADEKVTKKASVHKRETSNLDSSIKKTFKGRDGKKKYLSYLPLIDRSTNTTEYFKLYRDSEIGFDKDLQQSIKESVLFK